MRIREKKNVQRLDSETSHHWLLLCQLSGVGCGGYPSDRAVFVDRTASAWPRRKPSRKACQPATGREDRRLAWVDSWVDSDGAQPPAKELRAGLSRHGRRLTPTRNRCCNERVGSIQTHPRGRRLGLLSSRRIESECRAACFLEKTGVMSFRTAAARQHVKSRSSRNYGRWRQQALFQVLILRYDIHYNSHKYLVKCRETYSGDYLLHQQFTGTASIFFSFPNFKIFPTKKA